MDEYFISYDGNGSSADQSHKPPSAATKKQKKPVVAQPSSEKNTSSSVKKHTNKETPTTVGSTSGTPSKSTGGTAVSKAAKRRSVKLDSLSEHALLSEVSAAKPEKFRFVYFICLLGARAAEISVKIGYTNNIGTTKSLLQLGCPKELKMYSIIECVNEDAKEVFTAFVDSKITSKTGGGWYTLSKQKIDQIIEDIYNKNKELYKHITERKASLSSV